MLEKSFERSLCLKVKEYGGWAIKLSAHDCVGIPDRLILLPAAQKGGLPLIAFCELKRPRNPNIPEHQKERLRRLDRMGFQAYIISHMEHLFHIFKLNKIKLLEKDEKKYLKFLHNSKIKHIFVEELMTHETPQISNNSSQLDFKES